MHSCFRWCIHSADINASICHAFHLMIWSINFELFDQLMNLGIRYLLKSCIHSMTNPCTLMFDSQTAFMHSHLSIWLIIAFTLSMNRCISPADASTRSFSLWIHAVTIWSIHAVTLLMNQYTAVNVFEFPRSLPMWWTHAPYPEPTTTSDSLPPSTHTPSIAGGSRRDW